MQSVVAIIMPVATILEKKPDLYAENEGEVAKVTRKGAEVGVMVRDGMDEYRYEGGPFNNRNIKTPGPQ